MTQKVMAITTAAKTAVELHAKDGQNVTASIPNPIMSSTGIRVLAKYLSWLRNHFLKKSLI